MALTVTERPAATLDRRLVLVDTLTGTLAGRVIDQNGNPLVRVRVRVTNLDDGNQRATLTNAEGRYLVATLPLGRYSVETYLAGFVVITPTREPIKVQLNKTLETLPDIIMGPPPAVPAPVAPPPPVPAVVEDSAGRLTTLVDATRRANADERLIGILPLANIRTFDDLATLAAGVAPPPEVKGVAGPGLGSGIGTPGQFSVNGMRARSNNFTVDGSDNNDEDIGVRRQGFTSLTPQSIESVREIQIVSNLWDAEQGRSIGSQVNAVSRSGTNQVHGALYNFFNHDSLNARNFFDLNSDQAASYRLEATAIGRFENGVPVNTRRVPVTLRSSTFDDPVPIIQPNPSLDDDQYQRLQGGGVIGFPIWRDRTFFFGSFERQQFRSNQETHFSVPTIAQRGFLNFGATGFVAATPNQSPVEYSPTFIAGDSVFSLFPFPNNPVGPYGENTYTKVLPGDGQGTIYSLKFDHNFRLFGPEVSHSFTARYNYTDDQRKVPAVGGAIFSGVKPAVRTQNLSLFLSSQLTPTLSNQLRASYGRTRLRFAELRDPYLIPSRYLPGEPYLLNAPLISNGSFPDLNPPVADYRLPGPNLQADGALGPVGQLIVSPFSPVGLDPYLFPQARQNNTIQFADTLTAFRGQHTVKLGADIRRSQLNSFLNRNYRPQIFFGGSPDLTCLIDEAPIKEISQYGPNPSPKPGDCLRPGFFSGSDLAALGIPTGIFQALAIGKPDSTIALRFWQYNLFVNENWRTRHGLTLDFGLRYELNTTPVEANRRIERTFSLSGLPAVDSSYRLAAPFSNGQLIYGNDELVNSLNQTLAALRDVLGGRQKIFRTDRNNFNSHFSFAWDPFARRKSQAGRTVIRGGAGLYHDLTLGSIVNQSRNVFPTFIPYNVDVNTFSYARNTNFVSGLTGNYAVFNPRFVPMDIIRNGQITRYGLIQEGTLNSLNVPDGALQSVLGLLFNPSAVGLLPSGGGLAFTLPDNNLRSPMAFQYNLQVERELGENWLFNVAWVATRGVGLTRFRTPNGGPNSITLPVNPIGIGQDPLFAISLPPLSVGDERSARPNANLGAYTIFDSSASSIYHSLQSTLTRQFSRGFQMTAAYTWSHAIDDVSDIFDVAGAAALPQDDRQLRHERGDAGFDIRQRLAVSIVGGLPFLSRFDRQRGLGGALLGGWQWAAISTIQTGQPFTVNTSYDVNLDGNLTDRLDSLAGLAAGGDGPTLLRLNGSPLTLLAALGENGRVGRNTFRAPGVFRTELSLNRNIQLRGGHLLTLRVEAFNLWNRTHFGIPVRVLEAPSFGRSINTLISPRQIQFALKYAF
ncbi:MAG: carboxypeptidase regulatory-like domain-containing protein [Acidobacteriota bacterium]